ncbi:MAG: SgcJ/EcaC family oxidoreductase [Acidobacteriota bacterium]
MPGETVVSMTAQEAIQQVNKTFSELLSRGDAAGIARCYTEDALMLPPNQDLIHGRNNIEGFWRGIITAGVKDLRLESQNVEQHGDVVVEIGRCKVFIEENQLIDEAKYLVLWKQENGEWKLFRDMWNTSRPLAKP